MSLCRDVSDASFVLLPICDALAVKIIQERPTLSFLERYPSFHNPFFTSHCNSTTALHVSDALCTHSVSWKSKDPA